MYIFWRSRLYSLSAACSCQILKSVMSADVISEHMCRLIIVNLTFVLRCDWTICCKCNTNLIVWMIECFLQCGESENYPNDDAEHCTFGGNHKNTFLIKG